MKKTTRLLSTLCAGTLLSFGLQTSARAQTLSYTNATADAWLTPTSWSPANNWNSGAVKTNATNANVRLNIGTNTTVNQAVSVTYDATMGTTILNNAGVTTIGMVIGAGNTTTGAVNIAGGTLVIQSGTAAAGGFLIGNPNTAAQNPAGSGQASLTLSGGNLIFTNANGNGFGVLSVGYRGGSTNGGAHFSRGVLTISNGSVATIERVFFGFTTAETGAQNTGIINLEAGGTLSTRTINGRDGDANQMTSVVNFNGGTLRVLGLNVAAPTVALIQDATTGSNLTVNVQSGGAIIDTAGFNATSNEGLLDAGGGGGFTKNGLGTLTLTQTNTYTGATVLNGGSLSYILPMSSSSLTLANGTTNSITARDHSWTNTVTSVTNATINLALGAVTAIPSATTAVIKTASLNVSGVNVINITSGSGLIPGVVKLIDYTSSGNRSGGGSFVLGTLAPGIQATLIDGPTDVSLNVTLSVQSLIWTASANNNWATNEAANWNSGSGTYLEYISGVGDVANFTDAPSAFYIVNLPGTVIPADVILSHSTNSAVTISGAGQIAGTNGISKIGNGTTLLSLANSFTGVASVNNGILQIENGSALGSTAGVTAVTGTGTVLIGDGFGAGTTVTGETITLDGAGFGGSLGQLRGAIDTGANVWAGPIVLAANSGRIGTEINGNITVSGPITDNGSNYLVLYRPGNGGTITVANSAHSIGGSATFMGAGTGASVKLGVANGFSTNLLQVGPGNTDLNGFNQTISGLETFFGPGVLINNGGGASTLTIDTAGTNGFVGTASIQDGSQPISLVKEGTGRQSLNTTNAHTYTGNTVVNNGELRLGSSLGNTAVSVNAGASLTVNSAATIAGTITVNSGGTLSPGAVTIMGVLTNTSTVTLNAGSTNLFRVDVGNTNLNDRLVANNLSYGGTLVVTNQGATPLTNGQVLQLVSATTPSGNFANAASVAILPGSTGTFNPATGELTITAVPAAPTLNVVQTGNTLDFSWANLNGVYHLEAQTNSLNVGISTNWSNYPGGNTNSVTVPIDEANEAVFYRLVAP